MLFGRTKYLSRQLIMLFTIEACSVYSGDFIWKFHFLIMHLEKRRDGIGIRVTKANLRTANLEVGEESHCHFRLLLKVF
jgi:hypothetical protein